jgi:integrase
MDKIDEFFEKALITKRGTITVFRSHIQKYFKVIQMDMKTYFDNPQPYEDHIKKYWYYLQPKAPNTRATAISAVKNFLGRMDKQTRTLDIWDDITARQRGTVAPVTPKHVPDINELKQILHYCDIRTKASIMIALSSGMRINEVVQLLPNDIDTSVNPTKVTVRAEIAKNGRMRTTFISDEATNLFKEWMRGRAEYLRISLLSMNFKQQQYLKTRTDPRIFPYHPSSIRTGFNRACKKAGFIGKTKMNGDFDHKYNRSRRHLTYHHLRDFFRTNFGNVDLAEHLMGHAGYLSTYRQYNDKQLAEGYGKYVQNVTVFERPANVKGVYEELETIKKDKEEMQKMMQEMKAEILELRLEKLEKANGIKKR